MLEGSYKTVTQVGMGILILTFYDHIELQF